MSNEVALDLTSARNKSGLTQEDCAHLLDVDPSKLSRLETGKSQPSLRDLCTLSLVYGKPLESLARGMFEKVRKVLPSRLDTLPADNKGWIPQFNRNNTLNNVTARLRTLSDLDRGSA